MKSYIYACFLAIFAPVAVSLLFGGIKLVGGDEQAALIDLLTNSFVLYCYTSSILCLAYAYLVYLSKIKGKWWSNIGLGVVVLVLLPIPTIFIKLRDTSIGSAESGGAARIGMHLSLLFMMVLVAFIAGFLIKKKVQTDGVSGSESSVST